MSKEIIWAVNPYDKNPRTQKAAAQMALTAAKELKCKVEPVQVLELGLETAFSTKPRATTQEMLSRNQRPLQRALQALPAASLRKNPRVLLEASNVTAAQSRRLSTYAKTIKTPLIVAGTSAKGGLKRLLMGSFLESLVYRSHLPVLSVNPKAKVPKDIRKILFATDFSRGSLKAFNAVCEFALRCQAELVVYSSVDLPTTALAGYEIMAGVSAMPRYDFASDALNGAELAARRLAAKAKKKYGIKTSVFVHFRQRSLKDDIVAAVKKQKADVLALIAQADTEQVHMLGSTVQQIIRHSPVPVWSRHY